MVFEIAEVQVKAGMEAAFEAGVKAAAALFARAKGGGAIRLERLIETPSVYRLVAPWESVEAHMEDFRNSADFQEWRRLVGHCFETPPRVVHVSVVMDAA